MKYLLHYIRPHSKQAILAPLFKLLEAVFELLVPVILARAVDDYLPTKNRDGLISVFLWLAFFAFIGFLSAVTAQYFSAKTATTVSAELREKLFAKILSLSAKQTDKAGVSTLLTRITSDVDQVQTGVNLTLRLVLRAPIIVFGATVAGFLVSPKGALPFLPVVALLFLLVFFITAKNIPLFRSVQKETDKVTGLTREAVTGVRVLRAFSHESKEEKQYGRAVEALSEKQIHANDVAGLLSPIAMILVNGGVVLLLWNGSFSVNMGTMTQGQLVALVNYMCQILTELVKFVNTVFALHRATVSIERIQEVLDLPEVSCPPLEKGTDAITMEHVTFGYHENAEPVLDNISVTIKKGSLVGITGPTGCGKSTLLRLIDNQYAVTKGKIAIGCDNITLVPQKSVLFSGTIRSNLQIGKADATDEEMISVLKCAEAWDFVKEKGGLEGVVEKNGENFSGGQKQRLALARGLLKQPDLLLLDDATSALDIQTEERVLNNLKRLSDNMTILLVSQRTDTLKKMDSVLSIKDGKIL